MASQLAMTSSCLWSQLLCGFGWLLPEHPASCISPDIRAVAIWQSPLHSRLLEESGVGYGGEEEELTHGSVSSGLMLCLLQKLLDARLTDRRGVPA